MSLPGGHKDVLSECSGLVRTEGLCAQTWWSCMEMHSEHQSMKHLVLTGHAKQAIKIVLCHTCFDCLVVSTFKQSHHTCRLLVWTMQLLLACCDGCSLSLWVRSSINLHLHMCIQLLDSSIKELQNTKVYAVDDTKLRWRYCLGICKEHLLLMLALCSFLWTQAHVIT